MGGDAGSRGAIAVIEGELSRRVESLTAARVPFVAATVVRAKRSSSVRPGDCALVLSDGSIEGFVGGFCALESVRLHALRVLETSEPLLLRLLPGSEEVPAEQPHAVEGAAIERNPCLSGGSLEIFLEPRLPVQRLLIIGGAPIARALEAVAQAAGYEVVRGAAADVRPQAGDTAVIVACHGTDDEEAVLSAALATGIPYVALVASKPRGAAVRASLEVPDDLRAQLQTPAGLALGARTPHEIAISILAELVATLRADRAGVASIVSPTTAVDPVCGMEVIVTEATPQIHLGETSVAFCSERCRERYAHDAVVR